LEKDIVWMCQSICQKLLIISRRRTICPYSPNSPWAG